MLFAPEAVEDFAFDGLFSPCQADRQVTSRRRFLPVAAAAIQPPGSALRSASGRGCLGRIPPMDEVLGAGLL